MADGRGQVVETKSKALNFKWQKGRHKTNHNDKLDQSIAGI